MNYVDDDFVRNELTKIHRKREDIEIDWLTGKFEPATLKSDRITKSIAYWQSSIPKHFDSLSVDSTRLNSLMFVWLAKAEPKMTTIDDRARYYEIEIAKTR